MAPEYYESLAQETEIYADRPNQKQMEYICQTVSGIREKEEELDGYIQKYSIGWSVSRISKVARAILHVAMYEALYVDDVPTSAAINEAVELAKQFGGDRSPSFVNGVLGGIARAYEKGAIVPSGAPEAASAEPAEEE